jgi:uncharacterized protein
VLARYLAEGRAVYEVPGRERGESFAQWVDRVANLLDAGHDVLYQMPFVHDGIRGIADFVERVGYDDGTGTYEPIDAKLASCSVSSRSNSQTAGWRRAISVI